MPLRLPAKRPSKYRSKPTHLDGIRFDSKKEAQRWGLLTMLEKAGEIHGLERQLEFPLLVTRHRGAEVHQIGIYRADFRYRKGPTGLLVVEDVKSPATRRKEVYRLKKRIVEAIYGFTISEV